MKLKDIPSINIISGQIMTRVINKDNEHEGNQGNELPVLTPKAIEDGIIIKDKLGKASLKKQIDPKRFTQEGDVVIKLSTPYDAAYVTHENAGLIIPSFCAAIRISDTELIAPKYLTAFLNTDYVNKWLTAKVVGSVMPLIRIKDIGDLELPDVLISDMTAIGEAYMLSREKLLILEQMRTVEKEMMENIVLKSIKEGKNNE